METFVPLEPVAESTAPLSGSKRIAVTPDGVACVLDTYQVRIYCTDRNDVRVGYFGREGNGPGEFVGPTSIDRAPGGGIGVLDLDRRRLLVFRPTGELLSETDVPGVLILSGPIATSLFGMEMVSRENIEVDFVSGEIMWSRAYPRPAGLTASSCTEDQFGWLGAGYPTPRGGLLFRACRGQFLVWFADRDDDAPAEIALVPTYTRTLPTETEVASYVRGLTRMASGLAPPESDVEEFRNRPRHWHTMPFRFDGRGRTWIATKRDGGAFSYIDVHDGTAYVGTVRVRHSLIGIDIAESVLVVLVDRPLRPDDPEGIPQRGIDWYDIGGLEFATRDGPGL